MCLPPMSLCSTMALRPSPPTLAYLPFQRGNTFMPASGPPGSKASTGLPGPIPMPRLVFSLPSALRVPAIIGLCPRRERGNLKAIVKDAESKLAVPLRQRKQVLVHTLWRGCNEASMDHSQSTDGRQLSGLGKVPLKYGLGVTSCRTGEDLGTRDPDSLQMAAGSGRWGLWRGQSHFLCS